MGTVNIISSAEFVNMGHAPSFSDNLVQVEAAPIEPSGGAKSGARDL
jgi:hypothetical protein